MVGLNHERENEVIHTPRSESINLMCDSVITLGASNDISNNKDILSSEKVGNLVTRDTVEKGIALVENFKCDDIPSSLKQGLKPPFSEYLVVISKVSSVGLEEST